MFANVVLLRYTDCPDYIYTHHESREEGQELLMTVIYFFPMVFSRAMFYRFNCITFLLRTEAPLRFFVARRLTRRGLGLGQCYRPIILGSSICNTVI